ncbi:hypothetical protein B1748_27860 [Paenibacillus sp. MY03]|uniref:AraC family transcriptional regulator n=1 Tax=Paenibacillus sp. MY03 TaxID=302980 RepID=UPI000B3C4A0D|nr:AraC family transcriptional regulator [Paenibacillus sp. MY03]OUS70804.1 hypothetical protein B1748_27860 [Paenibacillus sp. MY03]
MKLIHEMDLTKIPFHLKFHYASYSDSPNFYHSHQGLELIYVHAGQGDILINRNVYEIRPNSLYIFQPYQLHRIRLHVTPETPYIRSKFLMEPAILYDRLQHLPLLQFFFLQIWKHEIVQPVIFDMDNNPYVLELMREYQSRIKKPSLDPEAQEESFLFLTQLFQLLKNNWHTHLFGEAPVLVQKRSHHMAEQVIQLLEKYIHEPLELDRIAAEIHVTKHHLSRLFKKATGSTISEYMTVLRIQRARILLETTGQSVEQISQDIGLGNVSYFCEIFKREVGMTPLQYRLFLLKHP